MSNLKNEYGKIVNKTTNLEEAFKWACDGPHHLVPYNKENYKPLNEYDKKSNNLYGDHLRDLLKHIKNCNHITEVGHNIGHTARVFLYTKPNKLVSYDIKDFSKNGVKELAEKNNIKYEFYVKNSLDINIDDFEQTDFLWLDGNHSETHVYKELNKFEGKVNKYIFSDDTEAEGTPGPTGYGVLKAFNKFLADNDNWELETQSILGPGFIGIKRK